VAVLDLVRSKSLVGPWQGGVGRPARHERAIARAHSGQSSLINMMPQRGSYWISVHNDACCGVILRLGSRRDRIPHESQFRAPLPMLRRVQLPQRLHAALTNSQKERLVGHISRDSTEDRIPRKASAHPPVTDAPVKEIRKRAGRRRATSHRRLNRPGWIGNEDDAGKKCSTICQGL